MRRTLDLGSSWTTAIPSARSEFPGSNRYSADLTNYGGTTGVFAADGTKVYVRSYAGTLDALRLRFRHGGYLSEFPLFSRTRFTGERFRRNRPDGSSIIPDEALPSGPQPLEVFDADRCGVAGARHGPTPVSNRDLLPVAGRPGQDGLSDDDEAARGTDANDSDSDGDGLLDGFEVRYGFNPLAGGGADPGHRRRWRQQSWRTGGRANPIDSDTDNDGIPDGREVHVTGTDPRDYDTDNDGWGDGIDNCPNRANSSQADVVHPNGIGDACEDPDADLAFDSSTTALIRSIHPKPMRIGDAAGDARSVSEQRPEARPIAAAFGLTGQPHRHLSVGGPSNRRALGLTDQGPRHPDRKRVRGIRDGHEFRDSVGRWRHECSSRRVRARPGRRWTSAMPPSAVSLAESTASTTLLGFVGASVEFLVPAADARCRWPDERRRRSARGTNPERRGFRWRWARRRRGGQHIRYGSAESGHGRWRRARWPRDPRRHESARPCG